MGRPRVNKGDCSDCHLKPAYTKGLCRGCYSAARYQVDKEEQRKARREYNKRNLSAIRERKRIRELTDLSYRMANRLRNRLNKALRGQKSASAWSDLGCSFEELKTYLESKFQEGMGWDNWTTNGWHIDHVRPLASFDLTDPEQIKAACHYTNLQPLWAKDNLSKGDNLGSI